MAKKKIEHKKAELNTAVADAFSEAEALQGELQDWYDNLPEAFQNGEKGEALQSAIDSLSSYSDAPEAPASILGVEVEFTEVTGRRVSRRSRLDGSVSRLEAARNAAQKEIEELEAFVSSCEDAICEWGNVEFPGMYG